MELGIGKTGDDGGCLNQGWWGLRREANRHDSDYYSVRIDTGAPASIECDNCHNVCRRSGPVEVPEGRLARFFTSRAALMIPGSYKRLTADSPSSFSVYCASEPDAKAVDAPSTVDVSTEDGCFP